MCFPSAWTSVGHPTNNSWHHICPCGALILDKSNWPNWLVLLRFRLSIWIPWNSLAFKCQGTCYMLQVDETPNIMPRSQTQKVTHCMILFIWNMQNKQIHKDRKISVAQRLQGKGGQRTADGQRVSCGGWKCFKIRHRWLEHHTVGELHATELSTSKWLISGTSLRVLASTAAGTGLIPGWGTKIPHAARPQKKKKRLISQTFAWKKKKFKYLKKKTPKQPTLSPPNS